jgi:radical SAM superfamily enzyme YgiQ (UPF0313 family)
VDFRDYQLFEGADAFDPNGILHRLEGHQQVLMISCLVDMLPVVIAAAEIIKSTRPDTQIILGGPGPTAAAGQFLAAFPQLDAVVMGEGEETIREWAIAYRNANNTRKPIPGMVHRKDGCIVDGGQRNRMQDLQNAVPPAYHLLDWSHYSAGRIITTRGCPYQCSFCDVAPLWGRKTVYRDIASVVEEILLLRDRYGTVAVSIADDTFVLNRDRVRAFCNLMLERRLDVEWGCFGRINLMSEELISLMAKAGCRVIFYGIDSGSPRVLKRTFKELAVDSILPTLEISARYFDRIEASFIWGYPFESHEDFLLTLDLAAKASRFAPKVNVQLHMLDPLPSSPICQEFKETLDKPEQEDSPWLLLPALMLDERASTVRRVIQTAPHLFPAFFCFPTPSKIQKREKLREVLTALHVMIGRAVIDERVYALSASENRELEQELLNQSGTPSEHIGAGLAIGLFKRMRQKKARHAGQTPEGVRIPGLVRQDNDARLGVL